MTVMMMMIVMIITNDDDDNTDKLQVWYEHPSIVWLLQQFPEILVTLPNIVIFIIIFLAIIISVYPSIIHSSSSLTLLV